MREFLCYLVCFGDGDERAKGSGGFASVDEGGVVSGGGDVLWVAEAVASEYAVELEGFKGMPGVRWGGGVSGTDVRHVVQMHIGNIRWGD